MKIKTTMRYHLTPVRMAIINKSINSKCWPGCGEKEPSLTVGGNADWCSHYGKQYRGSPKIKNGTALGSAFPFLGIYLKKPKTLI